MSEYAFRKENTWFPLGRFSNASKALSELNDILNRGKIDINGSSLYLVKREMPVKKGKSIILKEAPVGLKDSGGKISTFLSGQFM